MIEDMPDEEVQQVGKTPYTAKSQPENGYEQTHCTTNKTE